MSLNPKAAWRHQCNVFVILYFHQPLLLLASLTLPHGHNFILGFQAPQAAGRRKVLKGIRAASLKSFLESWPNSANLTFLHLSHSSPTFSAVLTWVQWHIWYNRVCAEDQEIIYCINSSCHIYQSIHDQDSAFHIRIFLGILQRDPHKVCWKMHMIEDLCMDLKTFATKYTNLLSLFSMNFNKFSHMTFYALKYSQNILSKP